MDKPWAEPFALSGTPWEYNYDVQNYDTTTKRAVPEAMIAPRKASIWEEDHGNAYSAALGAVGGASTVLLIVALVLLWRKPRRRQLPLLAPMDIGQNAYEHTDHQMVMVTVGHGRRHHQTNAFRIYTNVPNIN